jgi:hypothetical protein
MNMMSKLLASASLMVLATSASATTLTFNSQGNSGYEGFSTYTESGYTFTLVTPNAGFPHVGDGSGTAGTLNWHNNGDNGIGTYMLLTKVGGGAFNIESFDYLALDFLTVSSGAFNQTYIGSGVATLNLNGVTSVMFTTGGNGSGIDNVNVMAAAVPEPESIALMLAGLGVVGALRLRKRS